MDQEAKKTNQKPLLKLKKENYYYQTLKDTKIVQGENDAASISPLGMELISQYYKDKYDAEILLPAYFVELPSTSSLSKIHFYYDLAHFSDNHNNVLDLLKQRVQLLQNYRCTFILGPDTTHSTPIIYIKEGIEEGFFYFDSKKLDALVIEILSENTKIPVCGVDKPRQSDLYSCYADSLVVAKKATAKNRKTGQYIIPNLLSFLKKNSVVDTTKNQPFHTITSLPSDLLITSQLSSFSTHYLTTDKEYVLIHTNENTIETVESFKNRYKQKCLTIKNKEDEPKENIINSYLRRKGLAFAHKIIPIQFYVNQLKETLGDTWQDEERKEFIQRFKVVLKKSNSSEKKLFENIYIFVNEYSILFPQKLAEIKKEKARLAYWQSWLHTIKKSAPWILGAAALATFAAYFYKRAKRLR